MIEASAEAEAAPAFQFQPAGLEAQAAAFADAIMAGAAATSVAAEVGTDEEGLNWSVNEGGRGVVISVSKGEGPTMTFEEVLSHGATRAHIDAAKQRLRRRYLAA